ncbi:hypothetical protein AALO_G00220810, partial [Alosa alosa]
MHLCEMYLMFNFPYLIAVQPDLLLYYACHIKNTVCVFFKKNDHSLTVLLSSFTSAIFNGESSLCVCVCVCVCVPDEVERLVLVPDAPPGPAFVQQVALVVCPVSTDRVLASVAP